MIKDLLGALGSWDVRLREGTPAEIVDALDYFGHVAVVRGPVDVQSLGDAILPAARYVGILRERGREAAPTIGGVGMAAWAGDEDEKGHVFETPVVITNKNFADSIAAVLPPSVQVGFIGAVAGTYTGTHQFETPRTALNTITSAFGAEWYVGGDGKLYAGTTAQLYDVTPNAVVVRRNAGVDLDLTALGGKFDVGTDVVDYSTRVLLLGQTTEQGTFATGSADAPDVPFYDLFGNKVKRTRMISESGTTTGSVEARAALNLNRFNRTRKALKVTAEKYETEGNFKVGDFAYVYDPETGIFDTSREIVFRGEVLHPDVVRVSGISYPISEGHTVAFRRGNGQWIDLTRWVVWETGTNEVTVGDLPKSLTGGGSNPVRDRADAAQVDRVSPAMPTGVSVDTVVSSNDRGGITAQALVSWQPVTSNEDGSALTDLSNYIVAYKLTTATQWSFAYTFDPTTRFAVLPGRNYDYRIAAQDINGNTSDYSPTLTNLSRADDVPPNAPSDPVVSSYLGQLRIAWDGKDANGAAMPADFNRTDVHVGTTEGFTPSAATLVSSLVAAGVAYATAPYAAARYVKLVPYDNSGNAGQPSGSVTGATAQVGDGDIASMSVGKLTAGTIFADIVNAGRFATALTGARSEFNASGFYRFDANNVALFAADANGILVTGRYRSALSGRRVEMGASGRLGRIDFFAPDGSNGFVQAYTEGNNSTEAIQIGMQVPGDTNSLWNRLNFNKSTNGEYCTFKSGTLELSFDGGATQKGFDGTPGAGRFVIYQADDRGTGASRMRLQIDTKGLDYNDEISQDTFNLTRDWMTLRGTPQGTTPRFDFRRSDGYMIHGTSYNGVYQEYMPNGHVKFFTDNGWAEILPLGGGSSVGFKFFNPAGYGGLLKFFTAGGNDAQRIEARWAGDDGFYALWAQAFVVNSDAAGKDDIETVTRSLLADVRGTRVTSYKRKDRKIKRRYKNDGVTKLADDVVDPDVEIGIVAQEAPAQIMAGAASDGSLAVDVYQMCATLWGAVQELDAEIESLKKGKKK